MTDHPDFFLPFSDNLNNDYYRGLHFVYTAIEETHSQWLNFKTELHRLQQQSLHQALLSQQLSQPLSSTQITSSLTQQHSTLDSIALSPQHSHILEPNTILSPQLSATSINTTLSLPGDVFTTIVPNNDINTNTSHINNFDHNDENTIKPNLSPNQSQSSIINNNQHEQDQPEQIELPQPIPNEEQDVLLSTTTLSQVPTLLSQVPSTTIQPPPSSLSTLSRTQSEIDREESITSTLQQAYDKATEKIQVAGNFIAFADHWDEHEQVYNRTLIITRLEWFCTESPYFPFTRLVAILHDMYIEYKELTNQYQKELLKDFVEYVFCLQLFIAKLICPWYYELEPSTMKNDLSDINEIRDIESFFPNTKIRHTKGQMVMIMDIILQLVQHPAPDINDYYSYESNYEWQQSIEKQHYSSNTQPPLIWSGQYGNIEPEYISTTWLSVIFEWFEFANIARLPAPSDDPRTFSEFLHEPQSRTLNHVLTSSLHFFMNFASKEHKAPYFMVLVHQCGLLTHLSNYRQKILQRFNYMDLLQGSFSERYGKNYKLQIEFEELLQKQYLNGKSLSSIKYQREYEQYKIQLEEYNYQITNSTTNSTTTTTTTSATTTTTPPIKPPSPPIKPIQPISEDGEEFPFQKIELEQLSKRDQFTYQLQCQPEPWKSIEFITLTHICDYYMWLAPMVRDAFLTTNLEQVDKHIYNQRYDEDDSEVQNGTFWDEDTTDDNAIYSLLYPCRAGRQLYLQTFLIEGITLFNLLLLYYKKYNISFGSADILHERTERRRNIISFTDRFISMFIRPGGYLTNNAIFNILLNDTNLIRNNFKPLLNIPLQREIIKTANISTLQKFLKGTTYLTYELQFPEEYTYIHTNYSNELPIYRQKFNLNKNNNKFSLPLPQLNQTYQPSTTLIDYYIRTDLYRSHLTIDQDYHQQLYYVHQHQNDPFKQRITIEELQFVRTLAHILCANYSPQQIISDRSYLSLLQYTFQKQWFLLFEKARLVGTNPHLYNPDNDIQLDIASNAISSEFSSNAKFNHIYKHIFAPILSDIDVCDLEHTIRISARPYSIEITTPQKEISTQQRYLQEELTIQQEYLESYKTVIDSVIMKYPVMDNTISEQIKQEYDIHHNEELIIKKYSEQLSTSLLTRPSRMNMIIPSPTSLPYQPKDKQHATKTILQYHFMNMNTWIYHTNTFQISIYLIQRIFWSCYFRLIKQRYAKDIFTRAQLNRIDLPQSWFLSTSTNELTYQQHHDLKLPFHQSYNYLHYLTLLYNNPNDPDASIPSFDTDKSSFILPSQLYEDKTSKYIYECKEMLQQGDDYLYHRNWVIARDTRWAIQLEHHLHLYQQYILYNVTMICTNQDEIGDINSIQSFLITMNHFNINRNVIYRNAQVSLFLDYDSTPSLMLYFQLDHIYTTIYHRLLTIEDYKYPTMISIENKLPLLTATIYQYIEFLLSLLQGISNASFFAPYGLDLRDFYQQFYPFINQTTGREQLNQADNSHSFNRSQIYNTYPQLYKHFWYTVNGIFNSSSINWSINMKHQLLKMVTSLPSWYSTEGKELGFVSDREPPLILDYFQRPNIKLIPKDANLDDWIPLCTDAWSFVVQYTIESFIALLLVSNTQPELYDIINDIEFSLIMVLGHDNIESNTTTTTATTATTTTSQPTTTTTTTTTATTSQTTNDTPNEEENNISTTTTTTTTPTTTNKPPHQSPNHWTGLVELNQYTSPHITYTPFAPNVSIKYPKQQQHFGFYQSDHNPFNTLDILKPFTIINPTSTTNNNNNIDANITTSTTIKNNNDNINDDTIITMNPILPTYFPIKTPAQQHCIIEPLTIDDEIEYLDRIVDQTKSLFDILE